MVKMIFHQKNLLYCCFKIQFIWHVHDFIQDELNSLFQIFNYFVFLCFSSRNVVAFGFRCLLDTRGGMWLQTTNNKMLAYQFPIFVPTPIRPLTVKFAGKLCWFPNICNSISKAANKLNSMFCKNIEKKRQQLKIWLRIPFAKHFCKNSARQQKGVKRCLIVLFYLFSGYLVGIWNSSLNRI